MSLHPVYSLQQEIAYQGTGDNSVLTTVANRRSVDCSLVYNGSGGATQRNARQCAAPHVDASLQRTAPS